MVGRMTVRQNGRVFVGGNRYDFAYVTIEGNEWIFEDIMRASSLSVMANDWADLQWYNEYGEKYTKYTHQEMMESI